MRLEFLNFPYFLCLAVSFALVAGVYFLFRKSTNEIKRIALFTLMLANLGQHVCKCLVWPHLYGTGFGTLNTAYNLCAVLIYISPVVLLFGRGAICDAVVYIGTAGPSLTLIVPYWFNGQPLFQWEVLRFYTCHVLLIMTSLLPALWGIYRLSWRNFLRIPLFFFLFLLLIMLNYVVVAAAGLEEGTAMELLEASNPCWMMHPAPPEGWEWAKEAMEALSPKIFLGNDMRPYTPILWYALPMSIVISLAAFLLGALCDRKRFLADCKGGRPLRYERQNTA